MWQVGHVGRSVHASDVRIPTYLPYQPYPPYPAGARLE
jgi:hypothetical protein